MVGLGRAIETIAGNDDLVAILSNEVDVGLVDANETARVILVDAGVVDAGSLCSIIVFRICVASTITRREGEVRITIGALLYVDEVRLGAFGRSIVDGSLDGAILSRHVFGSLNLVPIIQLRE